MALDILAYAKHLEQAGVDRRQAAAHGEAVNRHVIADLASKVDLTASLTLQKNELTTRITNFRNELTTALHQAELRILGVIFAMLGLLVALIKLT